MAGETPKSVDRAKDTPDFCQTDPDGHFPDSGGDFCGPVAVANSLMYFAKTGFPKLRPTAATDKAAQIEMINRLAAADFMNTAERDGTSPPRLMAGVQKFVEQSGYQTVRLEQQGWKETTKQFPSKVDIPSLDWIKEGLSVKGGTVWLNVGWYKINAETSHYQRLGGHWVTLVGYGKDRSDRADPLTLLIHDPAPRTGRDPLTQCVKLSALDSGFLQRSTSQGQVRRREARGYYELKGEMKLKSGADTAILDAAVVLVIQ